MDAVRKAIWFSHSFLQYFTTLVWLQHLPQRRASLCKEKPGRRFCFISFTNRLCLSMLHKEKKNTTRELGEGNLSERHSHPHRCGAGQGTTLLADTVCHKGLMQHLTSILQTLALSGWRHLRCNSESRKTHCWGSIPGQEKQQYCQAETSLKTPKLPICFFS